MRIHRAIDNDYAFGTLVFAKAVVDTHNPIFVFLPYRSVERTNSIDAVIGQLLKHILHGQAVFADNIHIISLHFGDIWLYVELLVDYGAVECMEASEPIGREEYLLGLLVAHHHLRPMNHRGEYELQLVAAQRQLLTFVDRLYIGCNAIVTLQHLSGFFGTNQLHIRIHGKILPYTRRMVGFDMV